MTESSTSLLPLTMNSVFHLSSFQFELQNHELYFNISPHYLYKQVLLLPVSKVLKIPSLGLFDMYVYLKYMGHK